MDELETELRKAFPQLDIRRRQGDSIQIITPDVAVEIAARACGYEAKVVSLRSESDYDFETRLVAVLRTAGGSELVAALSKHLY
jgi:hypothetical protein